MKLFFQTLFCLLVFTTFLAGQDARARLQGIVTDSSNAVVVGATVTLANVNTGIKAVRSTNEIGQYLFDYVEPGSYTVTVELAGFNKFVQQNILVTIRADVTVNAVLQPGSVSNSVTVEATPVAVQFNSSSMGITVDHQMATELPRLDRNPFKFALLDPAAINTNFREMAPYHSWAANYLDLGGGTGGTNNLLIDGSPVGIGAKSSYTPNMDAVQEVSVQQNAVDAEFGHSGGGTVTMAMKSGTNGFHGSAFFTGRNPALNAITDRMTIPRVKDLSRQNMWGGSIGNPIIKNKLFSFFSFEQWKLTKPTTIKQTQPTSLQMQGDFSQTLGLMPDGKTTFMKPIYDPWSSVLNVGNNTGSRTPFPQNKILPIYWDPLSAKIMPMLWGPNSDGDDATGLNNFQSSSNDKTSYYNFSERLDYSPTDKWKIFGRLSRYHTVITTLDYTPNQSATFVPTGGSGRNGFNVTGDAVWTLSTTTVLNFHGDYQKFIDDYTAAGYEKDWSTLWPNNAWYKPYLNPQLPFYFPRISIGNARFGQPQWYWYQHPNGDSGNVKFSQMRGRHYLKAGFEMRHTRGTSMASVATGQFNFADSSTSNTWINTDTRYSGNAYASFLLGALSGSMTYPYVKESRTGFYGAFFQDDFKVSDRLTLNLGVRWEYELPWSDPNHNMSRYLDLTQDIPEILASPPVFPSKVLQYRQAAPIYKGAWIWTDAQNPGIWQANKRIFQPRLGFAYRLSNKMSLRLGMARYVTPEVSTGAFLNPPYPGFSARQDPLGFLEGKPQSVLSDPFPAGSNPLLPAKGKDYGRYLGLGGPGLSWYRQQAQAQTNDRLNLSFQRELPKQIVVDVTGFLSIGRHVRYSKNLQLVDPMLSYTYKTALTVKVPNPFYNYLNSTVIPGTSRNTKNVTLSSLLSPYPQYSGLSMMNVPFNDAMYQSLQIKVQRPFVGGYNFLFGYNYALNRQTGFFDDIATYAERREWQPGTGVRHRISAASIYEMPIGRGRKLLNDMPKPLEMALGGWKASGTFTFHSGNYLTFGSNLVSGNPKIDNPTFAKWFDTTKITRVPSYTIRDKTLSPYYWPGLVGPHFWSIDSTLSKQFAVTERLQAELKAGAYNLTNRLNVSNPNTTVTSSTFGRITNQSGESVGRQIELTLRLSF